MGEAQYNVSLKVKLQTLCRRASKNMSAQIIINPLQCERVVQIWFNILYPK